jgi:hypothetical protein
MQGSTACAGIYGAEIIVTTYLDNFIVFIKRFLAVNPIPFLAEIAANHINILQVTYIG